MVYRDAFPYLSNLDGTGFNCQLPYLDADFCGEAGKESELGHCARRQVHLLLIFAAVRIGTLSFGLSIELVGEKMLPSSVIDRTKCARLRGVHSKLSVQNLI
jgi:hypothetical protein